MVRSALHMLTTTSECELLSDTGTDERTISIKSSTAGLFLASASTNALTRNRFQPKHRRHRASKHERAPVHLLQTFRNVTHVRAITNCSCQRNQAHTNKTLLSAQIGPDVAVKKNQLTQLRFRSAQGDGDGITLHSHGPFRKQSKTELSQHSTPSVKTHALHSRLSNKYHTAQRLLRPEHQIHQQSFDENSDPTRP